VTATDVEEYELSEAPRVIAVAFRFPRCAVLVARRLIGVPARTVRSLAAAGALLWAGAWIIAGWRNREDLVVPAVSGAEPLTLVR
jgi:hypothetical protein